MTEPEAHPQHERFLPITSAAMVLVSFIAFGLTGGGGLMLLFSAAFLASYSTAWRMEKGSAAVWVARTLSYGTVMFMVIMNDDLLRVSMPITLYIHAIGLLMAAELVLQCWQDPPITTPRSAGAVLLSGIVFVAASKAFDEPYITWFTPLYILLVILVLRTFRPRRAPRNSMARVVGGGRGIAALILALAVGAGSADVVWRNRSQITNWFMQMLIQYRPQESTGMAKTPRLGRVFDLRQSSQRVLRLQGATGTLYLRGMAFDYYHRGEWGPELDVRLFEPLPLPTNNRAPPGSKEVRATRLVDDFRIIFVPLRAATVELAPGMSAEWANDAGGPLRTTRWWEPPFDYTFTISPTPDFKGPFCGSPKEGARLRYMFIPSDIDARVFELAQKIAGNLATTQEKIDAVVRHLTTNHTYSLSTDPGQGDPISNFILKKKSAHCEYFASAATMMLRCVGVPTRYVTGYMAHEAAGENTMVVRQRDAHAWAESWISGVGWVTVEATPGNGRPDETSADELPLSTRIWEAIQDFGAWLKAWLGDRSSGEMIGAVSVLGVLFASIQIWRRWRAKHPRKAALPAYHAADRKLQALGSDFSLELMRRGLRCPLDSTWQELLDRDKRSSPDALKKMRDFVALYNHLRFGPQAYSKEQLQQLRTLLTELQAEPQLAAFPSRQP